MKIIIFIIIACTLFVAWSLCIVGASADEQLEVIYAKDLERKENSMDNTYAPTENKEQEKIKVESIDTIVTMHGDKPYYENKYREVGDKCYHIGYSSYYLDVALEYRKKYFEVVERESDWIPCSERIPEEPKENPVFDGKCLEVYLVTTKYGSSDQDKVYPFRAFWNGINFTDGWRILDVIAWMPLPEPYREERHE